LAWIKFNILAGRELMRCVGRRPQQVPIGALPLLVGMDGRKMKSFDNTIDLTMPPR